MAAGSSFHSRLASIMEAMAKSALGQVCKLVDEDSAKLQLELSQLLATNSALARKVNTLECELTVVRTDASKLSKSYRNVGVQTICCRDEDGCDVTRPLTIEGIFGKDWCMNLWKGKDPYSLEISTDSQAAHTPDESVGTLSDQISITEVKEEHVQDAATQSQQETLIAEEHERLTEERGHPTLDYVVEGSTSSLSFDQDGEQVVSSDAIEEQTRFHNKSKLNSHRCVPVDPMKRTRKSCELCDKVFANPSALRIHYVVHTGEKPYRCTMCDKRFTQKGNLKCHLRIHTGEKPFVCVKCGKTFTQKVNLNHHLIAHRNQEVSEEKPVVKKQFKT
ncbi:zinc finger protein 470 [Cololabis saira]|uniref:zinc finger protein 470 n=1 Tax=Cololabis saira TaxID=129043 RepID=UPI002AD3BA8A|nr:zinc finger protein 470 [Cololabis saira]